MKLFSRFPQGEQLRGFFHWHGTGRVGVRIRDSRDVRPPDVIAYGGAIKHYDYSGAARRAGMLPELGAPYGQAQVSESSDLR